MLKLTVVVDQSARAVEITLLAVARTHEILNMRWSQLDLDRGQWDIAGAGTETAAPGKTEGGTGTKNIYDKRTRCRDRRSPSFARCMRSGSTIAFFLGATSTARCRTIPC
jgi:hypothetical protein